MPTALVTGVSGFIGSNLAKTLLDRGYDVRGVDNFTTGRERNLDPLRSEGAFTFREADVRDPDTIAGIIDGVNYVFHQAAVPSVQQSIEDPVTTTDVNCNGTATILTAAHEADVNNVVVASSSSVYGSTEQLPKAESMEPQPESPYALSKYYTEKLALQFSDLYDINTAALRYFNVFGPRQDPHGDYAAVIPQFISLMLDGERPVIYGDGKQSRDFVFIDNVVQANILAAEKSVTGKAFNIGCGSPITINELVDTLNDLLNTDIDPIYDDRRPSDVRHSHADISKAEKLLNYEPEVDFRDGLKRTIPYYRDSEGSNA